MAKPDKNKPDDAPEREADAPPTGPPRWSESWQLPGLIGAIVLLVVSVLVGVLDRPKPNLESMLDRAERRIRDERHRDALEVLNNDVRPRIGDSEVPRDVVVRFHLLRGRAIALGQRSFNVNLPANHESVVREYLESERLGRGLPWRDLYQLADSLIELDRIPEALARAKSLPASESELRMKLMRRMITRQLASPRMDPTATLSLIAEFTSDPRLSVSDRAWALARQAELLIRQGYVESAVSKLVREMPRVVDAGEARIGELYLLLGRAYLELGDTASAAAQLRGAWERLEPLDPGRGEALVLLARIDERRGELAEARDRFAMAIDQFENTRAHLPALLGAGEVTAMLGETADSLERYRALADRLRAGATHPEVTPMVVAQSLVRRAEDRRQSGEHDTAVAYADLAAGLFDADGVPAEVLLSLARAHRARADSMLADDGDARSRAMTLALMDPVTRDQARSDLDAAGRAFLRHADLMILADNTAFGESLWLAADSMDLAGDRASAIPVFTRFVDGFPDDPRRDEGRFRLAQAFRARAEYDLAIALYREIVREGGAYADLARVPLAAAILGDGNESNDLEAATHLNHVLSGSAGGPDSQSYRDALVEAGRWSMRQDDFRAAIARLDEAQRRFPDDPAIDSIRYDLADACRRDARAIQAQLRASAMPDRERAALEVLRRERLRTARDLFEIVRASLADRDPRRRSELDEVHLRNATFYVADASFDLGEYAAAVQQYGTAIERYSGEPASLVGMIQIVNAYLELGDQPRARAANEKARRFYESIPPDAWDDPYLPIAREDWQRWLDSLAWLTAGADGGRSR